MKRNLLRTTVSRMFWLGIFLGVILTACRSTSPGPTATMEPISSATFTQSLPPALTETPTVTVTNTPRPTSTFTPTQKATPTHSPTATSTTTPIPIYEVLRGTVNVDRVMCFYGPHRAYLFKYGVLGGSNLEIIGMNPDTNYIQVRAIGGDNPCWMNLEWMDVRGEISSLEPVDPMSLLLPMSPYYGPLSGVAAVRSGSEVTISWDPLYLRAGDDSEQEPYLVETWVCQNDELIFIPLGVWINQAIVNDEPGCSEPSHGRVYGVEKHGYTRYIEIPWPALQP